MITVAWDSTISANINARHGRVDWAASTVGACYPWNVSRYMEMTEAVNKTLNVKISWVDDFTSVKSYWTMTARDYLLVALMYG